MTTILLAGFVLAAPADEKSDGLQGEWTLVSMVSDGQAVPEAQAKKYRLTIRDGKWLVEVGLANGIAFTLTLDPSKSPKAIDLSSPGGAGTSVLRGIYSLDGDTLRVCLPGRDDGERPTEFKAVGPGGMLAVWKRVKK